jgi:hypothetical protein
MWLARLTRPTASGCCAGMASIVSLPAFDRSA